MVLGAAVALLTALNGEKYGVAIFMLLPLLLGAMPVGFYSRWRPVAKGTAWQLAINTYLACNAGLILFAYEGVICLVMAAPILLPMFWLGSLIGRSLVNVRPSVKLTSSLLPLLLVPGVAYVKKDMPVPLLKVVTTIDIEAPPQAVWDNVVAFPQLAEPEEWLFKTGIAYPADATIKGMGVGAVRHCNFTTGPFVEPITLWKPPHVLEFDVTQQPAPMKELSPFDIHPPHLDGYFESQPGQFLLTALPNGGTRLQGTTWYKHDIKPAFYWQLWTDYVIHAIHGRVLNHIKHTAEAQVKRQPS